jgi:hypothetical protein
MRSIHLRPPIIHRTHHIWIIKMVYFFRVLQQEIKCDDPKVEMNMDNGHHKLSEGEH